LYRENKYLLNKEKGCSFFGENLALLIENALPPIWWEILLLGEIARSKNLLLGDVAAVSCAIVCLSELRASQLKPLIEIYFNRIQLSKGSVVALAFIPGAKLKT